MRQKFLTARNIIAALFVILVSLCLVAGIRAGLPAAAYAAEGDSTEGPTETTQTEFNTEDFEVSLASGVNLTYTGAEIRPDVVVKHGDKKLVKDTDYTLSYSNNINITEEGATVTVTGTGDYSGTLSLKFLIARPNAWVVYPSAVGWKYGEYDPEATYIMAEPLYGSENMTLMISHEVSDGNFTFLTFGENNTTDFNLIDGRLPKEVSDKFASLDAGTYYLVASVPKTDYYSGLALIGNAKGVKFVVSRATNTWLTTPGIVQWTYGNYNRSVNVIKAIPQYPLTGNKAVTFGVYTDASCYADYAVEGLKDIEIRNSTAAGIPINNIQGEIFNRLPAGTYYLSASVDGNTNYTGLSTSVQFEVLPVQNHWRSTPNIVQWTYGEYNKEYNLISAEPRFGNREDVVLGIFLDRSYGQSADGLGEFSFNKIVEPVRDENGTFIKNEIKYVLPEGIEDKLGALGAGEYFLRANIAGEINANGLENYSSLSTVVAFRVQQAQNHWTVTPSVIGWDYGQFDKSANALTATSAFGETVIAIYHTDGTPVVYSDNGTIVNSFKLVENDGVLTVPDYVATALKGLNVGSYYLLASVKATNDYSGLNNYTSAEDIAAHGIEFAVSSTANGWVTIPKVLSWSEGHYDAEVNKITAEAKSGNDRMKIFILDANGRILTSNDGGNSLDYDVIKNLDVGSYTVRFTIEATNDYSELSGETTFAVFEDSVGLTGIVAAVIVFGIFDIAAAGVCIALIIVRRKKIEEGYRKMIRKELHRR